MWKDWGGWLNQHLRRHILEMSNAYDFFFCPGLLTMPQWFTLAPLAYKGRWRNYDVFGTSLRHSISTLSGSFLAIFFCRAVSSCVYDHNHPYLVSERLFLAENKAFPYPRRAGAHPRRAGAILWDAAATWPVVIFVAVAPKQRSQKLSMSWSTLYGLVDRLPVSTGNFGRALQRHFSVNFQSASTAVSFVNRFSKPRCHWKDLFLL